MRYMTVKVVEDGFVNSAQIVLTWAGGKTKETDEPLATVLTKLDSKGWRPAPSSPGKGILIMEKDDG